MKKVTITNGSDREIIDILVKDVDVERLREQIEFFECQEFDDKYQDAPGLKSLLHYMLAQAKKDES
jgi:hypothetical protein|tara:strand:- start:1110 stop:1307 length:198 start_codon:yes stop_codon:yes gene_type:complete